MVILVLVLFTFNGHFDSGFKCVIWSFWFWFYAVTFYGHFDSGEVAEDCSELGFVVQVVEAFRVGQRQEVFVVELVLKIIFKEVMSQSHCANQCDQMIEYKVAQYCQKIDISVLQESCSI